MTPTEQKRWRQENERLTAEFLARDGHTIDLITLGRWLLGQVRAGLIVKVGNWYSLSPVGPEAA